MRELNFYQNITQLSITFESFKNIFREAHTLFQVSWVTQVTFCNGLGRLSCVKIFFLITTKPFLRGFDPLL